MAKQKNNEWFDWVKALLAAFVLAFIVRTFLFAPIIVDGPSMQPTLHDRDQLIVNKFIYKIDEPERFDIVVFEASKQKDFIKRVIGLPGEYIEEKNDTLYIDGKEIAEPFLQQQKKQLKPGEELTYDFRLEDLPGGYSKIPEGYVLVLGDNRRNSTDSRILGVIPIEKIIGKTSLIYWPFSRMQVLHADVEK